MNRRGFLGLIGSAAVGMAVGTGLAKRTPDIDFTNECHNGLYQYRGEPVIAGDRPLSRVRTGIEPQCAFTDRETVFNDHSQTTEETFERFKRIRAAKFEQLWRETEDYVYGYGKRPAYVVDWERAGIKLDWHKELPC